MDISLNEILIQLGIYVVLLLILKTLYFEPLLRLIKRREELTTGREQAAVELTGKIEELKERYSSEIQKVSHELEEEQSKAIKSVRESAEKQLEDARKHSTAEYAKMEEQLQGDLTSVRSSLPKISEEVSKEVFNSVMSAKVVGL